MSTGTTLSNPNKHIVAMKTNSIVVERITTDSKLFAHTRWDTIPVAAGLLHCAYFFGSFTFFRGFRYG